jgi:hypothetical protein
VRAAFAVLCLIALLLYVGQIISMANFGLAQRLGLQESPENTDALYSCLERWTARWDLWWLWTLPAAGFLMLIDHWFWPYAAMIGGSAFIDAGGREAAKAFALREQGTRTGSPRESRVAVGTYIYLIATGVFSICIGLLEVI